MIKKGTLLNVVHVRKGKFKAIALEDFDIETVKKEDGFYPLAVAGDDVRGQSEDWMDGERIPCRASLCKIIPAHQREE